MIHKFKRPEARAKETVQIQEYLKTTNGQLDFRDLHAWIKADNR